MAMVYEDANGVAWRICPDETDPNCTEILEGHVVSFQRLGREDIVVCNPSVAYPETISDRRMAFEQGEERQWDGPRDGQGVSCPDGWRVAG